MSILFIILVTLTFFGILVLGLTFVFKDASKFYEEANRIEAMIRNNEPKEVVVPAILVLNKKAGLRHLSARIRELALMAEMKYDIQIISPK